MLQTGKAAFFYDRGALFSSSSFSSTDKKVRNCFIPCEVYSVDEPNGVLTYTLLLPDGSTVVKDHSEVYANLPKLKQHLVFSRYGVLRQSSLPMILSTLVNRMESKEGHHFTTLLPGKACIYLSDSADPSRYITSRTLRKSIQNMYSSYKGDVRNITDTWSYEPSFSLASMALKALDAVVNRRENHSIVFTVAKDQIKMSF